MWSARWGQHCQARSCHRKLDRTTATCDRWSIALFARYRGHSWIFLNHVDTVFCKAFKTLTTDKRFVQWSCYTIYRYKYIIYCKNIIRWMIVRTITIIDILLPEILDRHFTSVDWKWYMFVCSTPKTHGLPFCPGTTQTLDAVIRAVKRLDRSRSRQVGPRYVCWPKTKNGWFESHSCDVPAVVGMIWWMMWFRPLYFSTARNLSKKKKHQDSRLLVWVTRELWNSQHWLDNTCPVDELCTIDYCDCLGLLAMFVGLGPDWWMSLSPLFPWIINTNACNLRSSSSCVWNQFWSTLCPHCYCSGCYLQINSTL